MEQRGVRYDAVLQQLVDQPRIEIQAFGVDPAGASPAWTSGATTMTTDQDDALAERTVVFVGGLHRSGTTLLAKLLADHPACAQALDKWWRGDAEADAWIEKRIRGPLSIAALDLPRQYEATGITRQFLSRLAADPGADAETVGNLIHRFFPDWTAAEVAIDDAALVRDRIDGSFRDYLVALSLDIAMADPDSRDAMLTAGARLAASYDGVDAFKAALKRDLKFTKAAIDRVFAPLRQAKS